MVRRPKQVNGSYSIKFALNLTARKRPGNLGIGPTAARPIRVTRGEFAAACPADALHVALNHLEATAAYAGKFRRRAAQARTALQLVFLIIVPIRRENFIRLRVGHDIVRLASASWRIQLPAEATKNGRPYEAMLPQRLGDWLDRYLVTWRPLLLAGRQSDQLWVTMMGTDMAGDGFHGELGKLTLKLFGKAINPHAFRDGPATALAIEAPANVGAASAILGHSDPRTAERHYNQARTVQAADAWQEAITDRRKSLMKESRAGIRSRSAARPR